MKRLCLFVFISLLLFAMPLFAKVSESTSLPSQKKLMPTSQRIISLSPTLTEMVYAVGAGASLIAVDNASNFPVEANYLPKVGQFPSVNLESLIVLKPDLVMAEDSVHMRAQLNQLKAMGISVYIVHVRGIDDIPPLLITLGHLTHSEKQAVEVAKQFQQRYQDLLRHYHHRVPVSVFYELWPHPLLTVNRQTLINQVIEGCGGHNVFADAKGGAPEVSKERVLKAKPEVILMGPDSDAEGRRWQAEWRPWEEWIPAVSHQQMYVISPDLLARSSPRLLDAMETVCKDLDAARQFISPRHH